MAIDLDQANITLSAGALWVLNGALALVMFGIALNLKVSDFRRLFQYPKSVFVGLSAQFILLPFVTFVLVYLIDPQPSVALGMFLVSCCPGGVVSNFYSFLAQGNAALSITLTAIASLSAIAITPLNFAILGSFYEPTANILRTISLSPLEMVHLILLVIGVPIALGIWVNRRWAVFAERISKGFKIGSILFFTFLVVLVLYENRGMFQDYIEYVVGLVILHNLIALSIGYIWGRTWRLSLSDIRSVTIETGIQNSAIALLLILTFFDGLGGMAILAACWGLWHLISGLLVASAWSQIPIRKGAWF
jgi:BASS family bile acid:Na+ symporter